MTMKSKFTFTLKNIVINNVLLDEIKKLFLKKYYFTSNISVIGRE